MERRRPLLPQQCLGTLCCCETTTGQLCAVVVFSLLYTLHLQSAVSAMHWVGAVGSACWVGAADGMPPYAYCFMQLANAMSELACVHHTCLWHAGRQMHTPLCCCCWEVVTYFGAEVLLGGNCAAMLYACIGCTRTPL